MHLAVRQLGLAGEVVGLARVAVPEHEARSPPAWSETWSQSRICIPSPYIGSGSAARALVTNSGMSFSGCWYGP